MPGGDPNTEYPVLWEWLVETQGVRRMLDVGCGDGRTVDFFLRRGVSASGLDGIDNGHPFISVVDFTEHTPEPVPHYDLVWSCEFVEHVEERHMWRFMPYLAAGDLTLLTHAIPGQGGHHHVNCREREYWVGAMAAHGITLDEELTATTRDLARHFPGWYSHFHHTGLAFRRA